MVETALDFDSGPDLLESLDNISVPIHRDEGGLQALFFEFFEPWISCLIAFFVD